MKIAKKNVRIQTPFVHLIINLERPLEKVLKKGEYIAIKRHNTPGDNDPGSYEINLPYYGGGVACLERQTSQGLRWTKHQYGSLMVHVH